MPTFPTMLGIAALTGAGAWGITAASGGSPGGGTPPNIAPPPSPSANTANEAAQASVEKLRRMRALAGGKTLLSSDIPLVSSGGGKTLLGA